MTGSARARGLGAELRELRRATGLSMKEVGVRVGLSEATISRIETGLREITEAEIAAILEALRVDGDTRDRLLVLAQKADEPRWWEVGHPGLPTQLTALIEFERDAVRIEHLAVLRISGLLQTPDYSRAILSAAGVPANEVEPLVTIRRGRQTVLAQEEPPEFRVIIDEAVLRRPVGGRKVMVAQLRHIITVSRLPNVTIQVVPFGCGAHTGLDGGHVLLEFPKARPIVYLEHRSCGLFLDDPDDVAPFVEATDSLRRTALSPAESVGLVAACADEMEDG
ncbi:transcriptional regulator [Longimycelium tulufanense]|uniref:Transcriptional regulator n=2 Tax=Longimycelium tulufanense TaxID=907463 RepID=A0A8J3CD19_9PSEU|nr:transcriptional regulator [Longimycelium tulufanense]